MPNLIPSIKYMKRSVFESIKSDMSNLGRPWIKFEWPTWEFRLWNDFSFKRRTSHMPNLMHKLLKFIFTCKHFRPLNIVKMNWVRLIRFDVWIKRRTCVIWVDLIGHFRVPKSLVVKMSFNYDANKTHFHYKGFALSLVLKVRFFGTRKWPIRY